MVYELLREVRRVFSRAQQQERVFVNCHPLVADLLYGDEYSSLEELEKVLGAELVVRAMGHYHLERFEVYASRARAG